MIHIHAERKDNNKVVIIKNEDIAWRDAIVHLISNDMVAGGNVIVIDSTKVIAKTPQLNTHMTSSYSGSESDMNIMIMLVKAFDREKKSAPKIAIANAFNLHSITEKYAVEYTKLALLGLVLSVDTTKEASNFFLEVYKGLP